MKREVKVVICVVLAVWFFFMGFELGSYREKKAISASATTTSSDGSTSALITTAPAVTTASETTTAAPVVTTAPQSEESTTADSETTQEKSSQQSTTEAKKNDVSSMTKEQILKTVGDAVDAVKAQSNMTAVKTENITINVTDISVPGALNIVNNIINRLAGEEQITYNFVNGQATGIDQDGKEVEDEGTVSPMQIIPPKDMKFSLTADGVESATAEKQNGNTVYNIFLAEENTTFTEPVPKFNNAAFTYLDLTKLDLTGVNISQANMHYPKTQITATVDPSGKLTAIHYMMPMDGNGEAKIIGFSGNATFEGSDDEAWEFKY